jgi:hypothetical protein
MPAITPQQRATELHRIAMELELFPFVPPVVVRGTAQHLGSIWAVFT